MKSSGHEGLVESIDVLTRRAGRIAFPFHRMAPGTTVHREMQIPPARFLLEERRGK